MGASEENDPYYQQILELLLAGGYFRAHISTLSAFDKVVGGIAWGITIAAVQSDVDVIFRENSTVGQKIKIGEQLTRALIQMKCPYPLQSHQIQGLDYERLFPVMQWLVKKVVDTREELGDFNKKYALSRFSQNFIHPNDKVQSEIVRESQKQLQATNERYIRKRKFRRATEGSALSPFLSSISVEGDKVEKDSSAAIYSALLEYGHLTSQISEKSLGDKTKKSEKGEKGKDASGRWKDRTASFGGSVKDHDSKAAEAEAEWEAKRLEEERLRVEKAMSKLQASSSTSQANAVNSSRVGALLSSSEAALSATMQAYAANQQALEAEQEALNAKNVLAERRAAQLTAIQSKIEEYKGKWKEARKLKETLAGENDQMESKLQVARQRRQAALKSVAAVQEALDRGDEKTTNLYALLLLNDRLSKQESRFKESCKTSLYALKQKLATEKAQGAASFQKLQAAHDKDAEKMKQVRLVVAAQSRKVSSLVRIIDNEPHRAELLQFERRFTELFGHLGKGMNSMSRCYAAYNGLSSQKAALTAEVSLLNSMMSQHPNPKAKPAVVASFAGSMQKLSQGVVTSASKKHDDLQREKERYTEITAALNALREQERAYKTALKNFQAACAKHDELEAQLYEQKGKGK
jgi:hypothetical protein